MSDPYKNVRGFLGAGSHMETAAGSGAGLISLDEAARMGVDVSDLVDLPESGTTDTDDPSVLDPKNQHTTVGVRMPGAAKPPADVRPQTGYKDGQMIGVVTATIKPVHGSQKKGALPDYELVWVGHRFHPDGLKQNFGSESEAKKFAGGGETVKWYRPASPDPWEAMDQKTYDRAVRCLIEGDQPGLEQCIKGVKKSNVKAGRPAEGTEDDKGNPWGICKAQQDEGVLPDEDEPWTDEDEAGLQKSIAKAKKEAKQASEKGYPQAFGGHSSPQKLARSQRSHADLHEPKVYRDPSEGIKVPAHLIEAALSEEELDEGVKDWLKKLAAGGILALAGATGYYAGHSGGAEKSKAAMVSLPSGGEKILQQRLGNEHYNKYMGMVRRRANLWVNELNLDVHGGADDVHIPTVYLKFLAKDFPQEVTDQGDEYTPPSATPALNYLAKLLAAAESDYIKYFAQQKLNQMGE